MLSKVKRNMFKQMNGWLMISLLGAVVVVLPLLYIFASLFQTPNENWLQIKQYLLKDYLIGTITLILFTCLLTTIVGVALAWLVAAYEFPFKRYFRWALMLPLAIPPYIAAYTYGNMFSYTGVVQKLLRSIGVTPIPSMVDMLSMRGAVFVFTMFLYPYVFMIVRSFLERQSASYIENARLLGRRPVSIFFHVVLPLSRPAIVGGVMLVLFEVLSDYGVTSYFGIQTFSTAIFQTWFGMYDVESAMRLASWLMIGVAGLFAAERLLRRHRAYSATTGKMRPLVPQQLRGFSALAAVCFCFAVFSMSFLIPVVQLLIWAKWTYRDVLKADFVELAFHTISLAAIATAIIMIVAVMAANASRLQGGWLGYGLSRVLTAGYSIPGAIIAIGVLGVFLALDQWLVSIYKNFALNAAPPVVSLSLSMLIIAYVIRFMATGYNASEAGFEKIGMKYNEASRMLGFGIWETFFKVDVPLIRGALLTGFLLTFVEIVKELPLALLLRPFNFETLATRAYQFAGDERIQEASVPSLFIIGISLISVFVIHQVGKKMES
jgi:iron(III) transport system permease protein